MVLSINIWVLDYPGGQKTSRAYMSIFKKPNNRIQKELALRRVDGSGNSVIFF